MNILHTSDWHFGKQLDGNSRIEEQKEFVEELYDICEKENIDLILLAGDVFDNGNPSAQAEELFYKAAKKLCKNGTRPLIAIAGNHDSAERLTAADTLAYEHGLILLGTPKSQAVCGKYEGYEIVNSGAGFLEMVIKGEYIVVLTMAYPSEKRLNELVSEDIAEEKRQKGYSQRVGEIFHRLEKEVFREDTINIAMGHFYTMGGEESGSERPIQLGGAFSVNGEDLPKTAQYVALGHLHKPQIVPHTNHKCYYCGSPIAYSKNEAGQQKQVNVVALKASGQAVVKKVALTEYKPIEIWKAENIEQALSLCQQHQKENSWVYLEIKTDRIIEQQEIKTMKTTKKDIIEIIPIFPKKESTFLVEEAGENRSIKDQFIAFFQETTENAQPTEEVISLFLELLQEEDT